MRGPGSRVGLYFRTQNFQGVGVGVTDAVCTVAIDWQATGTMLQGIGAIAGAVTVMVAALIGANSFAKWRQQKIAERRIEQAERILTATYNVRRGLSRVRNPMMWAHETDKAEEQLKESGEWGAAEDDGSRRRLAKTQAYYNRLNRELENRQTLDTCLPMARALFSEDLEKALEKLNHQFWTVQVYVDAYLRDSVGSERPFRQKIDQAIYEGYPGTEENEVDTTVKQSVKTIEDACLPILRLEESNSKQRWKLFGKRQRVTPT